MKTKLLLKNVLLLSIFFVINNLANAQEKAKQMERLTITIDNGDTVVNGKAFKDLPETEKAKWRDKIKPFHADNGSFKKGAVIKMRSQKLAGNPDSLNAWMFKHNDDKMWLKIEKDSLNNKVFVFRDSLIKLRNNADHIDWKMVHPRREMMDIQRPAFRFEAPNMMMDRPSKPNSNSYSYSTTDQQGFTTKLNLRVEEPNEKELKNIFKKEGIGVNDVKVSDLVLFPSFDKGTITLSFNSNPKSTVAVKLLASDGSVILTDTKTLTSGNYQNKLSLNKNGIYYLQITANNKSYTRKIVKY